MELVCGLAERTKQAVARCHALRSPLPKRVEHPQIPERPERLQSSERPPRPQPPKRPVRPPVLERSERPKHLEAPQPPERSESPQSPPPQLCACRRRPRTPHVRKSQSRWYVKQPTWRLWGEERVDGAIYTVYLKKVRYHRPNRTSSSDSEDEISHLEWETVRVRFVKAGTLERLVEALATDDGELESTYVNVFLATYRSFATPERVLALLLRRYEQLAGDHRDTTDQHKRTLVSCLHVWLDTYPEDFRCPPHHAALQKLLVFTQTQLPGSELHTKVLSRLETWSVPDYADEVDVTADAWDGVRTYQHAPYRLPHVPHRRFAEQLTRMDTEVFKKLVPHQCLGAVWSRRDERRRLDAASVLATVAQFNAVSLRVISSVLAEHGARPAERAAVLAAWLDIAQELRVLKNFSSLKAIVSALQSTPVHRLRAAWAQLSRERVELFDELARIFSEDNNRWAQRELLVREGTAKFADTAGERDRQLQKLFQRQTRGVSHGTVPYLGTFLTDLTMIDTAIPDTDADGLINFDKRRKEFEVLAQIKLLQGAANAYHLREDPAFDAWFRSLPVLDEREAYRLSCLIEPEKSHRKNDSIASTGSGGSCPYDAESKHSSLDRGVESRLSSAGSTASLPSLDNSLTKPQVQASAPDFYIVRVRCEASGPETAGVVMYKSIMLSNKERTPQVVRNAMLKLGLEGDPDHYTLAQILPDREMVLPSNANVYYAMNTTHDLNFILRARGDPPLSNGKAKHK